MICILSPADYCNEDEFYCGGRCIESERVCDGRPDCADYSDEYNCSSTPAPTPPPVSHAVPNIHSYHWNPSSRQPCPEDECADGTCIYAHQRCNGVRDCSEGEDENGCREYPMTVFNQNTYLSKLLCHGYWTNTTLWAPISTPFISPTLISQEFLSLTHKVYSSLVSNWKESFVCSLTIRWKNRKLKLPDETSTELNQNCINRLRPIWGDYLQMLAMKPNSHVPMEIVSTWVWDATVTTTVKISLTNRIALVNKQNFFNC